MNFITNLEKDFQKNDNRALAIPMENYMKNNFTFFGIKTEERRTIFKTNYEKYKSEIKANFRTIAWELFNKNEREFHQCAIDLLAKEFKKNSNMVKLNMELCCSVLCSYRIDFYYVGRQVKLNLGRVN